MHDFTELDAALTDVGWAVVHEAIPRGLCVRLHDEAVAHRDAGRLRASATGRSDGRHATGLRGDATLWLDDPGCGEAAGALVLALEQMKVALNRRLTLGLDEVEAHFAHYPPGAGYARHLDRFRSDDARVLSLVLYLNDGWPEGAGGELRLYLPGGAHDIAPRMGTLVLFLSADVEHEVLPATRPRFSVAAWFRQRPRPA